MTNKTKNVIAVEVTVSLKGGASYAFKVALKDLDTNVTFYTLDGFNEKLTDMFSRTNNDDVPCYARFKNRSGLTGNMSMVLINKNDVSMISVSDPKRMSIPIAEV